MKKKLDVSEVTFIKRYPIGNYDPTNIMTNEEIETKMNCMCKELENNKGMILGQEKNFIMFQVNEHQVIMQYIVYHIGYRRRF